MRTVLRLGFISLMMATLLTFVSCVGATRMVTRERGPRGQQLESKTVDPTFVQPGATTRDEVLSRLSMVNSGYEDPHFFWGRWATSKWGYWWLVVAPSANGGGGAGAGDAHRVWHVHNILITFDDQGVTKSKLLLDDDSPLWHELNLYTAALPPPDSAENLTLYTEGHTSRRIHLGSDRIEIVQTKGKKTRSVQVQPDKITRISNSGPSDKRNSPGTTCHTLYVSEKTDFGRKFKFCTTGATLIATLRYLHRFAPPDMKWE